MWSGPSSGEMAAVFGSLAGSPDPVFVTDRHNRIVFWNKCAERILGYVPDEVVGKPGQFSEQYRRAGRASTSSVSVSRARAATS